MPEAVCGSELKHPSCRRESHDHGAREPTLDGGNQRLHNSDDERTNLDGKKELLGLRVKGPNVSQSASLDDTTGHKELPRDKRPIKHFNSEQHHQNHSSHLHQRHPNARQVTESKSKVFRGPHERPTHTSHMQHKSGPFPGADHQEARSISDLSSELSSDTGTPFGTRTNNHLIGSLGEQNPSSIAATFGSYVSIGWKLINYIIITGWPLYVCLMLGLVFFLALRCCKNMKPAKRIKQKSSLVKSSQKIKKFGSSPISIIGNGKVSNHSPDSNFQGAKIMKDNEFASVVSMEDGERKKALDCHQLAINMEVNEWSTEDSDGQQWEKGGTTRSNPDSRSKSKPTSLGMLKYGLEYDFEQSILIVSIIEARNLPGMDMNGLSDPYVNIFMSNNKSYQMFKTKVHKHTLNPVFNETFKYHISYAELNKQTLILSVYDHDRLSKHDEIGQLTLPMSSIDLTQRQVDWSELRKTNDSSDGCMGDICLSLRYVPTAGRLNVVIQEARQLRKMDVAGLSDPYVKLVLMSKGKRLKKKKTSIKKCTLNPHYNESFSFEFPFEQSQDVQLVITVVDYDRIGTSEPIGKIVLGCEQTSGETELRHWMDMLASPRRQIAQWHSLKRVDFEPKLPFKVRRFSQFITNKHRDEY